MSTGHLDQERKSDAELYRMLGEGDTPELYARKVKLITNRSIPYGGGNSVDGRNVYIDEQLYREIMLSPHVPRRWWIIVPGMTAAQIVQAIIEHEHTEWAIAAGDNPVDVYEATHQFGNAKESHFVESVCARANKYNEALQPALKRCLSRYPNNPPRDLWCAPYIDKATARDKELLRIFRAKGVVDASKLSKEDVGYGIGEEECRNCSMFGPERGELRTCTLVSGLVCANRHCDRWQAAKAK